MAELWSAAMCEYTVGFKWCSVGAMLWDLLSKVTFFLFSVPVIGDQVICSFISQFLVYALHTGKVFGLWDPFPHHCCKFTFAICHLCLMMHFVPTIATAVVMDFLFCSVCAAILELQCGGRLSDTETGASVMIVLYSKWLKSHVWPISTFSWTAAEPLTSVCPPHVSFTHHSVWEGLLFA